MAAILSQSQCFKLSNITSNMDSTVASRVKPNNLQPSKTFEHFELRPYQPSQHHKKLLGVSISNNIPLSIHSLITLEKSYSKIGFPLWGDFVTWHN